MAASEALIESTVRHQVFLERLKSGEVNQFTAFLQQMDRSLRQSLAGAELTNFNRARLERLLKSVESTLNDIFKRYYNELAGHLMDLAEYEAEFESRNLANVLTSTTFETVIPAMQQVRAAVLAIPLSVRGADGGKLLEPFIRDWTTAEQKRMTGAIRQGYFEGQTNGQIIQALRGTRANGFRDGMLATTTRNAEAVVRTAVQHVASVARFETWQANETWVTGYRWVSTLDSKTSSQCRTLDGQVFPLNKGPKPPLHIRCRSTTVAELDGRYRFLKGSRTRAAQNGPVGAETTYYQWLKRQPAEFQDDVLGPTRGKLFRDGGLSTTRFAQLNLHRNFRPMTLDEMRKKEPAAFSKALGEE